MASVGLSISPSLDRDVFHRPKAITPDSFVAFIAAQRKPDDIFALAEQEDPSNYYNDHRWFYFGLGTCLVWLSLHFVFWCLRPLTHRYTVRRH